MTANIWTTGGGEWDSSQILCEEAELNADGAQQGEGRCLTEERYNNAWLTWEECQQLSEHLFECARLPGLNFVVFVAKA